MTSTARPLHRILCTDYREHNAHVWESVNLGLVKCPGREPANVDVLPRDMFVTVTKGTACIRFLPSVDVTVCERLGRGQTEFTDKRSPRFADQHCLKCDAAYRDAHNGRTPVCY